MSEVNISLLDRLAQAQSASKQTSVVENIPIYVDGYEKDAKGTQFVLGAHALTGEQVRIYLTPDSKAESRANSRTSLEERGAGRGKKAVKTDGILVLEGCRRQSNGTISANWTNSVAPDGDSGCLIAGYVCIRLFEGDGKGSSGNKAVFYYQPNKAVLVDSENGINQHLTDWFSNSKMPSCVTPRAMIRLITTQNNVTNSIVFEITTSKDKANGYALQPAHLAINDFWNGDFGKTLKLIFSDPSMSELKIEMIPGGVCFFTKNNSSKMFVNGKIKHEADGKLTMAGIIEDRFHHADVNHYAEGVVGIRVVDNPNATADELPRFPICYYANARYPWGGYYSLNAMPSPNLAENRSMAYVPKGIEKQDNQENATTAQPA